MTAVTASCWQGYGVEDRKGVTERRYGQQLWKMKADLRAALARNTKHGL